MTKARLRAGTLQQVTGVDTEAVVFGETATDAALQELDRDHQGRKATWLPLRRTRETGEEEEPAGA